MQRKVDDADTTERNGISRAATSVRRVAVVGSRHVSHAVCDALLALRVPIALDILAVDDRLDGGVSKPGNNIRLIGGFGANDHVDRFDLSARYDAVVYAFDAPHLLSTFIRPGLRSHNKRGLLVGSANEFILGGTQHDGRQNQIASPDMVASGVSSIVSDLGCRPMGWSAVDPARWIAAQYPNAVIVEGDYKTVDEMFDVSA
ncbi:MULTISPECIES: hypothetical protein [Rhodococcus]|uniref:hypothetical protein n=1 Tax=Rhodococcus TaxID=1827 RepID=UPI00071C8ABF|nr:MULTISPECIES: hypothetical protein [Rhodococcus]ANQ75621.1 hypothetical protein AOT96_31875 [Rhodococcus sp. 008]KSU70608.1 hypothetical protein AS032_27065 [Rhodococcus qingshengii]SCC64197.1 hypothetical protein GA0061093_11779 [Rhodococcus qingshengii]